jgi:hypothetical protein
MGGQEVEISGSREEVIKTIEELPSLITNVSKAFESIKNKVASSGSVGAYPSVSSSGCSDAVLELLGTDWGSKARTLTEIGEALKANALHYPSTTLSGVLAWLVRKNKIKRWKTGRGYVYILSGGRT